LQTYLSYSLGEFIILRVNIFNFFLYTAPVLSNYIILRLRKRYSLSSIFRPLLKRMRGTLTGFQAKCQGRFRKKQRADVRVFRIGRVSLSKYSSSIFYSFSTTALRYGAVGIRIAVCYD